MVTYVLVHGGWLGGWCWQKVVPLLRAAGHEAYTPTLTGLGERVHLRVPELTLDTHIEDIANVLVYEDLRAVILVGHSYAGAVITGVADRLAARLAHLVYLDALVPRDGESVAELLGRPPNEESLPPPPGTLARFGVVDAADRHWAEPRLTPMPALAGAGRLRLANAAAVAALPRTYVRCTAFASAGIAAAARRVREEGDWRERELAAGHAAMITHPRETADLLLGIR